MRSLKKMFIILILYFFVVPTIHAATFNFDGEGEIVGGSGSGNSSGGINDFTLQQGNALKITLIKLSNTGFGVVDTNIIFNTIISKNNEHEKEYYKYSQMYYSFISDTRNASGGKYCLYGKIANGEYTSDIMCLDSSKVMEDVTWPSNSCNDGVKPNNVVIRGRSWFSESCDWGFNINAKLTKNAFYNSSTKTPTKRFFKTVYNILKNNIDAIKNNTSINNADDLEKVILSSDSEYMKEKVSLKDYRILVEPVYGFQKGDNYQTDPYKFATLKAIAYHSSKNYSNPCTMGAGICGFEYGGLVKNFNSDFAEGSHGVLKPIKLYSNPSASTYSNVYTGFGYMIISIIDANIPPPPVTSTDCNKNGTMACCYDASGVYHADYKENDTNNYKFSDEGYLISCAPSNDDKCPDTYSLGICGDTDGTTAKFYENNNLKECALSTNTASGFTLVSESETYAEGKSYCSVACKDDIDIELPTKKTAFAGQYFLLDNYTPSVKVKRTCVTSNINYNAFRQDLTNAFNALETAYWNWVSYNGTESAVNKADKKYQQIITAFNKCVNWVDTNKLNMNELAVKFTYDTDEFNIFKNINLNKEIKDDLKTSYYYWENNMMPDNGYTNGKKAAKSTDIPSDTIKVYDNFKDSANAIEMEFKNVSYIKREEEIKYEFKAPILYSLIPSGKIQTSKPSSSYILLADGKSAVPISINTPKTTNKPYDYLIEISGLKDSIRSQANHISSNFAHDNFQNRFDFDKVNTYKCNYEVKTDIIDNPNDFNKRLNFFYRTVDMSNINPNNRTLGYNWSGYNDKTGNNCKTKACKVNESMKQTDADYQVLTNGTKEKFEFTLTPAIMQAIRNYNGKKNKSSEGSYSDWDLRCDTNMGGSIHYYCFSNFLTCLANGGNANEGNNYENCKSIFGNTLNNYSQISDYGELELRDNREKLIKKLQHLEQGG